MALYRKPVMENPLIFICQEIYVVFAQIITVHNAECILSGALGLIIIICGSSTRLG